MRLQRLRDTWTLCKCSERLKGKTVCYTLALHTGKEREKRIVSFRRCLPNTPVGRTRFWDIERRRLSVGVQSRGWFVQMIPDEQRLTTHKHKNPHAECLG